MTWKLIACLISLWLGNPAAFAADSAPFEQANRQFAAGDFKTAAATYQEVLRNHGPSAAVFYNLGNCYQRLGQYGPAILAYERARLLSPRDPDLLANLRLARKAAAALEEPRFDARLDAMLNHFSRNEWSWLVAGAALLLGSIALIRGAVRPSVPWLRRAMLVAGGLCGLAIITGSTALYLRRGEDQHGVILSEGATVRLSPFAKADVLGTPGPGRLVRMDHKRGEFRYIEVPGSNLQGWIPENEVAAINP